MKVKLVEIIYKEDYLKANAIDSILSEGNEVKRGYAMQSIYGNADAIAPDELLRPNYRGPTFIDGSGCTDLHVLTDEAFVRVNYRDTNPDSDCYGMRVSYMYPTRDVGRVRTVA